MNNQQLIKKIKELEKIKPRAEFKNFNRDVLLSQIRQIESLRPVQEKSVFGLRFYIRAYSNLIMQRVTQPVFALLLLLGLVLGSSLTVNAAFYSLPGTRLYAIKIGLERTQLALVRDEVSKTELKMEFAKKRVEEIDKIVALDNEEPAKRTEKINQVIQRFKKDVASVKNHMQNLDLENEESLSLKMAMTIDSATSLLAESLNENAEKLPEDEKGVLQDAADSAEATGISALEALVNVATSTENVNININKEELSDSLAKKIIALKTKLGITENIKETDLAGINAVIAQAEQYLATGEYDKTLAAISEIKELIKMAESVVVNNSEGENAVIPPESTDAAVEDTTNTEPGAAIEINIQVEAPANPPVTEDTVETTIQIINQQ